MLFHTCRLRAFTCSIIYQNHLNFCGDINSTIFCHAGGKNWADHIMHCGPYYNITSSRPGSAMHSKITFTIWTKRGHLINYRDSCIASCIASLGGGGGGTDLLLKKGDHWTKYKLVVLEKNLSNDLILAHKVGHCDLFSYISLYNNHEKCCTVLFVVIPKKKQFSLICFLTCFSITMYCFVFRIEYDPVLDISFFLTN